MLDEMRRACVYALRRFSDCMILQDIGVFPGLSAAGRRFFVLPINNPKRSEKEKKKMKKYQVHEQVKAEVSEARKKAILEELEDELSRIASRVDIDDDGEIRLEGLKERFCEATATLTLEEKNDKYILNGDIVGKADTIYWGVFGGSILLFLISLFILWPLLLVSVGIDVVLIMMLNGSSQKIARTIGDKFRDVVKKTK